MAYSSVVQRQRRHMMGILLATETLKSLQFARVLEWSTFTEGSGRILITKWKEHIFSKWQVLQHRNKKRANILQDYTTIICSFCHVSYPCVLYVHQLHTCGNGELLFTISPCTLLLYKNDTWMFRYHCKRIVWILTIWFLFCKLKWKTKGHKVYCKSSTGKL